MPVTVNEVQTQIEVEGNTTHAEGGREEDALQAMQRWQQLAREQQRRESRTAAWGFDD